MIRVKRVYEAVEKADGQRVLVERLWPRGMKKEEAHLKAWLKEVAPSPELRKWYSHDVSRWPEFQKRYLEELKKDEAHREAVAELRRLAREGDLTLVYAAKDEEHNSATVLKRFLG